MTRHPVGPSACVCIARPYGRPSHILIPQRLLSVEQNRRAGRQLFLVHPLQFYRPLGRRFLLADIFRLPGLCQSTHRSVLSFGVSLPPSISARPHLQQSLPTMKWPSIHMAMFRCPHRLVARLGHLSVCVPQSRPSHNHLRDTFRSHPRLILLCPTRSSCVPLLKLPSQYRLLLHPLLVRSLNRLER